MPFPGSCLEMHLSSSSLLQPIPKGSEAEVVRVGGKLFLFTSLSEKTSLVNCPEAACGMVLWRRSQVRRMETQREVNTSVKCTGSETEKNSAVG